ncbi:MULTISPECIES: T9SS type B sorting domain-containing protein [unclassified Empedobacter]|uniref:T9SS type B sorting domain-containing protein n=1 Tax=unclassified Empedobacter TaxID=2643773 RepID=UPI0025C2B9CB|nr:MULTISPECIES: T9SS type B sorting domain-containing protein [unclassified Empedobacter]
MKKIFYFLLLMISGIVWGQHPLINKINDIVTSGITLPNESVNSFVPRLMNCEFHTTGYYNFYYYVAPNDMDFEFTLKGNIDKFHFMLWRLSKNSNPNDIFVRTGSSSNEYTTINPIRAVYSNRTKEKGLKGGKLNDCISNSTDGFVSAFENGSKLKEGEIIVIAIYGTDNPILELTISGAKTVDNLVFDNHCYTDDYLLSDVKTKIINDIRVSDPSINVGNIEFYKPDNTSTNDNISYINGIEQILYARVYDNSNKLVYIYKPIKFKFIPELIYTVQNKTEQYCATSITFAKEDLISKISPSINSSKYADYEVYVDDAIVNGNIPLINSNNYNIKLKYIGIEFCPVTIFSDEVELKLENSNPILPSGKFAEVCNSEILSEAEILTALGVDSTIYRLVNMPTTPYNFIGNEAKFNVQIEDRSDASCTSNIVEFTVKKKTNVDLDNLTLTFCRSDFSFSEFELIINNIKKNDNSVTINLVYNGTNYNESQLQNLYNEIYNNRTQTSFNLSITGNKAYFCEATVSLKIVLINSIPTQTFADLFNPGCLGAMQDYTFKIDEIKNHIKDELGIPNIADFDIFNLDGTPFLPVNVNANSNQTLSFKIKKVGESCFSEDMYLIVKTVNQPNVVSATFSGVFCEGETLTIDDDLLKNNFGLNVFDYKIFIDGTEYIQGNSIQRILNFGGNTSLNIPIEFKNTLREICLTAVELTVNKKQDLVVDIATLENYTQANPIIYCEGEDENAKSQIKSILDIINKPTQYPNLVAKSSVDEIFNQFNSEKGFVNVVFEDPNYCGTEKIKFYYQKNALPDFAIPTSAEICSATKYILDFEELAKEKGLDVTQYDFSVVGNDVIKVSTYQYELGVGDYTITIKNINSGCPKEFILKLTNSETPTIDKITINEKSIIVSAKGKGKLEYALFDSKGDIIIDWQTNNELIIPDKITDNNFTVKVRLNGCGVFERKDVIYLVLPNVVTPNQDGKNDVWKPMTKNGKVNDTSNSYKLIIFDRYGKHILSQEGIGIIEWDGTHNGKPVADGTYWYLLESNEELQVLYSGYIVVKRKIN